jgi:Tol biopolymer transport system component
VAYQSSRRGTTRIFVLDATDGGSTAVTSGEGGMDYVPDWQAAPAAPAAAPPAA